MMMPVPRLGVAGAALLGLILQPANAYTVLSPGASVAGKSITEWTADWWTWGMQAPFVANPLLDATGAFANQNNNGPVFFIGGNFTPNAVITRNFTVPAGTPILLPMLNVFDVEPPITPPSVVTLDDRKTAADAVVQAWLGAVIKNSLFASIDGNAVAIPADYLAVTGLFDMGPTQAASLLENFGLSAGTDTFPTKSGGYWLMIDGLTAGVHEFHFGGAINGFDAITGTPIGTEHLDAFSTDTTDFITVVAAPEPGSALLLLAGLGGLLWYCRRPSTTVSAS
jgi:hypothetical protein